MSRDIHFHARKYILNKSDLWNVRLWTRHISVRFFDWWGAFSHMKEFPEAWLFSSQIWNRLFRLLSIIKVIHAFCKKFFFYYFFLKFFVFVTEYFFKIYFIIGCIGSSLLRAGFVSSCGERALLFVAVCRLLLLRSTGSRHVGSSSRGSRALEHRLSSCGARA